ncbi:TonB-dependent receptor [Mucilaginibacter sp.]|uniref:SusC/RagA family TonB-linked outer membrane protein n=1 Tax=Mucilaginibacter sp. TaxID=1882438 RepID=UPI002847FF48|nr:TonB-dependent receptor [Mucilaginibacter sp.]MDR3697199.1 TonB-dependent receptor [Mucilaginibacter sp.]
MKKNLRLFTVSLSLLLCFMVPRLAMAQSHILKGVVVDTQGEPLPGVSVMIQGTNLGVTTATDGSFSMSLKGESNVLVLSFIGFDKKAIQIKSETTIRITLQESKAELKEVVVVGYGSQKKSEVTGAISSIKNKEFKDQPVSNLAASIEGKLSGVNVTQPSGTPGAGLLVSIRGAQNPLYVIDGVPMESESNSSLGTSYNLSGQSVGSGQNISSISDINPDDIESIEILKDASKAIYGSRAANGVVLVTTKRGKAGQTVLDFNMNIGVQSVEKEIPFLNSRQFYNLTNTAIKNDIWIYHNDIATNNPNPHFALSDMQAAGIVDANGKAIPNPAAPYYDLKSGINTNWENAIFRTAPVADYEISARGGTDKTKFFIGGSYYDQDGIIINNYYKRYNLRANIDNQATDKLSFGLNTSASYSDDKRSFNDNTYTGIVTNALGASPLMPVYSSPGVYANFTQYQAYWLSDNPVKSAKEINAHTYTDRFISSLFAEYKIMKDLKFKSTWSIDYNDVNDNQYFSPLTVDAQAVGGKLLLGESKTMTWLNENTFNYQHQFGKNNLTLLAGYSQQQSKIELSQGGGEGFPGTGGVQNINNAATPIVVIIPYPLVYDALRSFISRANYSYDEKYLLSFIMRADGSSKFAPGHQWGYFPSASLGWNMTNESFLQDNKNINSLKLRASYGLSGDQDNVPSYQDYAYWGAAKYNGDAGFVPYNILGPAPLTWQTNKTFNIGADFELFNHFISGSVEYFISDETKLLNQEQIPGTSGFQWAYANSGKIEDKGLEIQFNTNNIKSRDFTWTSSFNISFLKNTIKSLAVDNQYVSSYNDQSPTNILKVGQPVGTFIGVRFAGVDPANGDALYYAADGTKERADQVNFTRDATIIGNARPKFFGGFTNEFKYKKFDALISTQFTYGNKVFNLIRTTYESLGWSSASTPSGAYLGGVYANNDTRVLGAWSHPGQITNIPRPSFLLQNYFPNSDQFLENGSFLKVRTVNIGYTLGKTKYFNSIRFYLQAENLLTISNYIGFDPEVSSTGGANAATAGIDYAAYPPARTISLGVDVKF